MSRIFIFTGKGGVGKTSVASAHAVRSAREGKSTLLVSADMAHNLGDIFQVEADGRVREIAPNLSVLELDPYMLMREEYPHINRAIGNLSGSAGLAVGQIGETYMIPGLENLFSLLKIRDLYLAGIYRPYGAENRFVVLTREANASMEPVHDRMPLILSGEEVLPWVSDAAKAGDILTKELPMLKAERPYEQISFEF